MARNSNQRKKPASQRQLRVGEEIRHALSSIFMRDELHEPGLSGTSVTVSEVRISPDLKNATAYVMPLGGGNREMVIEALTELAPNLRSLLGSKTRLKFTPRLTFRLDDSFDEAHRINSLLNRPDVAADLSDDEEDATEAADE